MTATHPPRRVAFTLVELLVVIAIIGLLVALIIQGGGAVREAAQRARCQSTLKGLATAYMAYVSDYNMFPLLHAAGEYRGDGVYATWYPQNCTEYIYRHSGGGPWHWDTNFGPLVWHGLVSSADAFVCPAVDDSDEPWWQNPHEPDGQWFYIQYGAHFTNHEPFEARDHYFTTPGESTTRSIATYCLRPGLNPWTPSTLIDKGYRALMADNLHFSGAVLQRHVSGVNVAYFDGHTEWRDDAILTENMFSNFYVPLGGRGRIEDAETWVIWRSLDEGR